MTIFSKSIKAIAAGALLLGQGGLHLQVKFIFIVPVLNPEETFGFTGNGAHQPHRFLGQEPEMQGAFCGKALIGGDFVSLEQGGLHPGTPAGNGNHICFHGSLLVTRSSGYR